MSNPDRQVNGAWRAGVRFFTRDGRTTGVSRGFEHLSGYTRAELLAKGGVEALTPPQYVDAAGRAHEEVTSLGESAPSERLILCKDGSSRWVLSASARLSSEGDVGDCVEFILDITEWKHAGERLHAIEEQLRTLARQVGTTQEDERRRLARDLHDHLGQQMTALRLCLASMKAAGATTSTLTEQIVQAQALAEELDRSLDYLTWELRPAPLEYLDLSAALAHLAQTWSDQFGIPVEYDVRGGGGARLERDVEGHLYRIAQEALHNIYKHARATRVAMLLDRQGERVVLTVEDDGRGFEPAGLMPDPANGGGLGLVSMRERALLAGGDIAIESRPGRGTTILVRVPVGTRR